MTGVLGRFAAIGALPGDTDEQRIRKGALVLAAGIISALAPVWVLTYSSWTCSCPPRSPSRTSWSRSPH